MELVLGIAVLVTMVAIAVSAIREGPRVEPSSERTVDLGDLRDPDPIEYAVRGPAPIGQRQVDGAQWEAGDATSTRASGPR